MFQEHIFFPLLSVRIVVNKSFTFLRLRNVSRMNPFNSIRSFRVLVPDLQGTSFVPRCKIFWFISDKRIALWFMVHSGLYKSRYCWVPLNKCTTFPSFFIVLLYSVIVCVIDIFCSGSVVLLFCVNLFIGMFHDLVYFNHRVILSFWTAGSLLLGRFINYNIKIYTRWFTWKTLNS